jgi:hypothetical protein
MKFQITIGICNDTSNLHIQADSMEEALDKAKKLFQMTNSTGECMNVSVFKEAENEAKYIRKEKKYEI